MFAHWRPEVPANLIVIFQRERLYVGRQSEATSFVVDPPEARLELQIPVTEGQQLHRKQRLIIEKLEPLTHRAQC